MQNLSCSLIERHPRFLHLGLTTNHLKHIVARAEHVRHPEQVGEDGGGFQGAGGLHEDVGPLGQVADEVDGVGLGEEVEVCVAEFFGVEAGFARDGAETGVGVLQVWAGVTFEGGHGFEVEVVAVDTVHGLVIRRLLLKEGNGHTAFRSYPAP